MSQEQEEQSAQVENTYNTWLQQEDARLRAKLPAFIAALEGAGIREVIFEYQGEGDEGEIYEIETVSDSDTEEELPTKLNRELQDWAMDVLNQAYSGWMNNDGSRGEIHLDVEKQQVTINHEYRIYEYEAAAPLVVLTLAPNPPIQGEE